MYTRMGIHNYNLLFQSFQFERNCIKVVPLSVFKVSFFFTSNKVGESKRVYIMFPDMTDPFSEQKEDGYALQKSV